MDRRGTWSEGILVVVIAVAGPLAFLLLLLLLLLGPPLGDDHVVVSFVLFGVTSQQINPTSRLLTGAQLLRHFDKRRLQRS